MHQLQYMPRLQDHLQIHATPHRPDIPRSGAHRLQRRRRHGGLLAEVPQRPPPHALPKLERQALAESALRQDQRIPHRRTERTDVDAEAGDLRRKS
jgi:hypothetical protein